MKKHILTALLITTMISMTACGKTTDDVSVSNDTNTNVITESTTLPSVNDELKIGVVNKDVNDVTPTSTPIPTATPKTTETPTPTITPVTTEAPKTTEVPAVTSTPAVTEVPKSTEAPKSTEKPKSTENTTTTTNTSTETKVESTPTPIPETPAPAPVETPAPVGCNHEKTYYVRHDTHDVTVTGGCYDHYAYDRVICSYCGEVLSDDEVLLGTVHHSVLVSDEIPPTCTEDGVAAVNTCDCGGDGITGGHTLPATGHAYHDEFADESVTETNEDGSINTKFKYHTICYKCGDVTNEWWEWN